MRKTLIIQAKKARTKEDYRYLRCNTCANCRDGLCCLYPDDELTAWLRNNYDRFGSHCDPDIAPSCPRHVFDESVLYDSETTDTSETTDAELLPFFQSKE